MRLKGLPTPIRKTVVEPSDLLATDLTISSRVYNYTIMCYIYDTNKIIVRPMKNCSVAERIRVYQDIFSHLEKHGLSPTVEKMDSECPQDLKDMIVDKHKKTGTRATP